MLAAASILCRPPAARAGDLVPPRPPVRLELAACLVDTHDAIERAIRVEVGDPPDASDASAITVAVECAADGVDAGIVVEVRPPGNPRRYRYALGWRTQPLDARPRLIGLAVAEAVDASRIELTAVPEPPIVIPAASRPTTAADGAATGDWRIAVIAVRRAFSSQAGVELVGGGLLLTRRLSPHLALSADLLAETATVLTASGAVGVLSVSSAPRFVVRVGHLAHAELGAGARFGIVRMRGEALPGSAVNGATQIRPWLGAAADLSVGTQLTQRLSVHASAELGVVIAGATARDFGNPVASISGIWHSLGVAAALDL
ncbi:MAG TPA: hypothetical protein VLM79_07405 [Kofleriaceae bacterium]|nr:hypothetical protein [Kofleriaceae bacterium]